MEGLCREEKSTEAAAVEEKGVPFKLSGVMYGVTDELFEKQVEREERDAMCAKVGEFLEEEKRMRSRWKLRIEIGRGRDLRCSRAVTRRKRERRMRGR